MKLKRRIRSVLNTSITSNAVRTAELQSMKFHLSLLEIFFNLRLSRETLINYDN